MLRLYLAMMIFLLIETDRPRLLIIGDSLSRGLYAGTEETTFARLAGQELGMDVEILPVCTLAGGEEAWPAWRGETDAIIVELGINDVSGNPNCPQVPMEEWRARYGAFLDALLATGARVVVGTVPWCGWMEDREIFGWAETFNGWISAEARTRGIRVADLWGATLFCDECLSQHGEVSPFPPGFEGDGFHPGDHGHATIARAFVNALEYQLYLPLLQIRAAR